jgi:hypothetical protein
MAATTLKELEEEMEKSVAEYTDLSNQMKSGKTHSALDRERLKTRISKVENDYFETLITLLKKRTIENNRHPSSKAEREEFRNSMGNIHKLSGRLLAICENL